MSRTYLSLAGLALAALASQANAYDVLLGKVTLIDPTGLPGTFAFQMDVGSTTCPTGTSWIYYTRPDASNNKGAYAGIVAALMAKSNVRVYLNPGDTNCNPVFLHLLPP